MNITKGKKISAKKVVIYGTEGIGKSTFASQFPDPLFIDTEDSTKELDVRRFDKPSSWTMLLEQVKYVIKNPECCKSLVIDTADWAEQLEIQDLCSKKSWDGLEDAGYGKGYQYSAEEFGRFLDLLSEVTEKNIHIVITAHAQIRKFELPDEMGAYDRWEMKTSKKVAPMLREWADMVLFANYKTITIQTDKEGKKFKAQGGTRVMYTQHHPCWDAKNRFGLAEELPFSYKEIEFIFNRDLSSVKTDEPQTNSVSEFTVPAEVDSAPGIPELSPIAEKVEVPEYIPKPLADLMTANHVTEEEIRMAVSMKGYFPYSATIDHYGDDFINGCLIGAWPQVYKMIQENKKNHPFAG